MVSVLVLTLVMLWNFFALTAKDVSDRVITNPLNAINSQNIACLLAEGDSGRFWRTSTIPPHGSSTPE